MTGVAPREQRSDDAPKKHKNRRAVLEEASGKLDRGYVYPSRSTARVFGFDFDWASFGISCRVYQSKPRPYLKFH